MPLGELTQVIDNARGVGAEVVRSVSVNKDASLVIFVVGIAPEMVALLNDKARLPLLRGETLGDGQSGKSGTDDETVDGGGPRAKSLEQGAKRRRPGKAGCGESGVTGGVGYCSAFKRVLEMVQLRTSVSLV